MEIMLAICLLLLVIVIISNIFLVLKIKNLNTNNSTEQLESVLKDYINQENRNTRVELNSIISNLITTMSDNITNTQYTLDTQRNSQLVGAHTRQIQRSLSKITEKQDLY